jgi:hypothetical protein
MNNEKKHFEAKGSPTSQLPTFCLLKLTHQPMNARKINNKLLKYSGKTKQRLKSKMFTRNIILILLPQPLDDDINFDKITRLIF